MAHNNPIKLGFKKKDLEKKGRKINHVHPIRFLGTVFSDPYLKGCMKDIRESYFKWHGFVDGYSVRMEEEHDKGNLLPYVNSFCQIVNGNPDQVRAFIMKRDWEGLMRYLVRLD